jgi:hypothetical protein
MGDVSIDFSTATPSVNYQLVGLDWQFSWLASNGFAWPSEIAAVAWLPANDVAAGTTGNPKLGTPYRGITDSYFNDARNFADHRPINPTYTQALAGIYNHLYAQNPNIIATTPPNHGVSVGNSTAISSTVTFANSTDFDPTYTPLSHQWQVSTNGGTTWTNITGTSTPAGTGATYSGFNTTTLTVSSATNTADQNQYRLVVGTPILPTNTPYSGAPSTGGAVLTTSNPATLTVVSYSISASTTTTPSPIDTTPLLNEGLGFGDGTTNVTTNDPNGYQLSISSKSAETRLMHTTDNTCSINGTSTTFTIPGVLTDDTWGYALASTAGGTTSNNFDSDYTSPTSSSKYAKLPASSSPQLVRKTTAATPNTGESTDFHFAARTTLSTCSGAYKARVLYTVVGGV